MWLKRTLIAIGLLASSFNLAASSNYKPFVLADTLTGSLDEVTTQVTTKLKSAGFEIVGQYSPYIDGSARIIGITNTDLKAAAQAAKHSQGGFGAVLRVAITDNKGTIEVSYVNPPYIGYAYHLGDMGEIEKTLETTLGNMDSFGSAKGLSKKSLDEYHYAWLMPYFKDSKVVAKFASHEAAVAALDKAIGHPDSDMSTLWKVRIAEDQIVYGVDLNKGWWKDKMKNIMGKLDVTSPKATAALPWEMLISGNEIIYLPGKFRIAMMFPDTSMGQFMTIKDVPDQMDKSALELGTLGQ